MAALYGQAGPCRYKWKARHQIDEIFLSQNITVTSNTLFCSQVATALTLPLIWVAFEGADKSFLFLPNDLKHRFKSLCQDTGLNLVTNPIDKIVTEPTGSGVELSFVELVDF